MVNCNLQRLDGPVRGNGKIIQELEGIFRGAGWNVIKVVWGSGWDPLLAADKSGLLLKRMEECVDGEYQDFKSKNGAYVREHFFGKYPELLDLVKDMTDDQIWALSRGGHDPAKVYTAYKAAVDNVGTPTVILAKTVKGYGMGEAGEGQNITHQQKKMGETVAAGVPRPLRHRPCPTSRSPRSRSCVSRTTARSWPTCGSAGRRSGGYLPARRTRSSRVAAGAGAVRRSPRQLKGTGEREISTTMAFVRMLTTLLRDKQIGKRVVPIVPDESRTFGMEGLFRQFGIFSQVGQLYRPEDANQLMYYKEDKSGQMLQEGINEAGAMSSWIAAATSYSVSDTADDPVLHLLLDVRVPAHRRPGLGGRRLPGARVPAGRHRRADHAQRRGPAARGRPQPPALGDHPELRLLRPDLRLRGRGDRPGRPAADVRRAGGRLLLPHAHERELQPPRRCPRAGREEVIEGIKRACTCCRARQAAEARGTQPRVQLLGSGTILREVDRGRGAAGGRLRGRRGRVELPQLHRAASRRRRRRPLEHAASRAEPRTGWATSSSCAGRPAGPVVAATDYMRAFAEQIRPYVPSRRYTVLGTDGFGRSDYRRGAAAASSRSTATTSSSRR